jgi:hypothetical protein
MKFWIRKFKTTSHVRCLVNRLIESRKLLLSEQPCRLISSMPTPSLAKLLTLHNHYVLETTINPFIHIFPRSSWAEGSLTSTMPPSRHNIPSWIPQVTSIRRLSLEPVMYLHLHQDLDKRAHFSTSIVIPIAGMRNHMGN